LTAHNVKPKDPSFAVVHQKIQDHRSWPHFKKCIGAIDGTHILVTVPLSEQAVHINRHGYYSQNVMVVCDFDMRFTFVVSGWPGSAHDTHIWRDTLLNKYKKKFPHHPTGTHIHDFLDLFYEKWSLLTLRFFWFVGKYYLLIQVIQIKGDIKHHTKGQRYHIPEFQNGSQPIGLKEVFNHAHSPLRHVIERSFGVLKMKWCILLDVPSYPLEKQ
jgi:hypothetical protein